MGRIRLDDRRLVRENLCHCGNVATEFDPQKGYVCVKHTVVRIVAQNVGLRSSVGLGNR